MRFWCAVLSILIMTGCSTGPQTASSHLPDPLNLNVRSFTLPNGLTLLVLTDTSLPVFSLYTFYKVGGKDEQKGITGASHFLEHLMFKGTKNMSATKFDFLVEGNGGVSNAYTTNDMTVYHENMPVSALDLMLGVEADRMVNLVLDKNEFEQERQVVLEERKMRYENSPRGQLYLRSMEELFRGTPYGTSVIGDIADLHSVTRDQIYQYYQQWYAPNNATIVIVGDVDADKAFAMVKKHFASLPASAVPAQARAQVPADAFVSRMKKPVEVALPGPASLPMFLLAFTAAPSGVTETYAQDLLSSILGEGNSSHLQQKYVLTKNPQVAGIYAGNMTLEKSGMFMVGGELVKGTEPARFKNGLIAELKQSCTTAVNEENLRKVKNQFEVELFRMLDTTSGLAQFIGDRQALYGDWAYYRQELMHYRSLTVVDVQAACQRLFNQPAYVWVTVWEKNPAKRAVGSVQ